MLGPQLFTATLEAGGDSGRQDLRWEAGHWGVPLKVAGGPPCSHCSDFYLVVKNLPTLHVLPHDALPMHVGSRNHGPSPLTREQNMSFIP